MQYRLDFEPVEARAGVGPGQRQAQYQVAQRVEDARLDIGQEWVSGIGVWVPEGQAAGKDFAALEQAERQEVLVEIAVWEGAQTEQQGQIKERGQREVTQQRPRIGIQARARG